MAGNIGGPNIDIGMDGSKLESGIKSAEKAINLFLNKIAGPSIEGVIKGDPLSGVNKALKNAQSYVSSYSKMWVASLDNIEKQITNKFVKRSVSSIKELETSMNSLMSKRKALADGTFGIGQNDKSKYRATAMAGMDQFNPKEKGMQLHLNNLVGARFEDYLKNIKKLAPEAAEKVNIFLKKLADVKNNKVTKAQAEKMFQSLYQSLNNQTNKIDNRIKQTLQNAEKLQGGLQFSGKMAAAKDETEALKRRTTALKESYITEAQARTEITKGINVAQNKIAIMRELEKRERLGKTLTKKYRDELASLRKEYDKLNRQATGQKGSGGFMSPQWFKQRILWFVQLRAAWMAWRAVVESFREAFAFEQEMQNVQAITQATTKQFSDLKEKALEMGTTTRYSAKEAAEAMTVMAQAGLSTKEIYDSIENTANLATATLNDFKDTAKLVTTIMRAWNMESTRSAEIVDTLATAINKTKLTMGDMATAFNYVTGIAPQLHLSLQETTAMLGTMVNHGLKASTASTSLRASLASLLKPTDALKAEMAKLKLTMDDINPEFYSVTTILQRLKKAGFGAAESYKAFSRRAAGGFAILVENADTLEDLTNNIHENNRAQLMAKEQLNSVQSQWKLLKDEGVKVSATINDQLTPSLIQLIIGIKDLLIVFNAIVPVLTLFNLAISGTADLVTILTKGWRQIEFNAWSDGLREVTNQIRSFGKGLQATIESYRKLKDTYTKYNEAIETGKKRGGKSQEDLFERALYYAKQVDLVREEEIVKIQESNTKEEARLKLEELINKAYDERKRSLASEYLTLTESLKKAEAYRAALIKSENRDQTDEIRKQMDTTKEWVKLTDTVNSNIKKAGNKMPLFGYEEDSATQKQFNKSLERFKAYSAALTKAEQALLLKEDSVFAQSVAIVEKASLSKMTYYQAWLDLIKQPVKLQPIFSESDITRAISTLEKESFLAGSTGDKNEDNDSELLARRKADFKMQANILDRHAKALDRQKASESTIHKLELEQLKLKKEELNVELGYTKEVSKIKDIKAEIYAIDTQIGEKNIEIANSANAWTMAMSQLRDEAQSTQEIVTEFTKTMAQNVSNSAAKGIVNLVQGFPEARAQADELKVSLSDLKQQYKEAMGDGRVEEARNLKDQMKELGNEIDDLEDPLHNAGEAFKEWGLSILDMIQDVILKLMAAQIAATLFGDAAGTSTGGAVSGGDSGSSGWGGIISTVIGGLFNAAAATGGVLPQVKSFQAFSSGGLTGGTTMALLGDNPSKKELVIPSENIKSNRVEGYTRNKDQEQQPITVVNVLTKQDIATAIAGSEGKNVIMNHIGKDLNNNGPMAKRISR